MQHFQRQIFRQLRGEPNISGNLRRQRRISLLSALILVPLFLGAVDALAATTHLQDLLYPSLAAIGYELFVKDPHGLATSLRNAVIGPIVGAALGAAALAWLPAGPWQVMLVTLAAILAIRTLDIILAPALSVALLTLLARENSLAYVLSVALSSLALTIMFRVWRLTIYVPLTTEHHRQEPAERMSHDE